MERFGGEVLPLLGLQRCYVGQLERTENTNDLFRKRTKWKQWLVV